MKFAPLRLVKAHLATYVNAATGEVRVRDHLWFEGLPLLVLAVTVIFSVKLSVEACAALLTVCGLLSAFLFAVMLQIAERALAWADENPEPGPDTTFQAKFLGEIAANAGYASLMAIAAAVAFVVASVTHDGLLIAASGIGLALGVNMTLVLLMVLNRVYAVIESQLIVARTGGNVTRLKKRSNTG